VNEHLKEREPEQLLDDVLAESSPTEFRAALFGETLRLARRRRRWRRARQASGIVGMLVLAAWLIGQNGPKKVSSWRPRVLEPAVRGYHLVETRPLPAKSVVATRQSAGATIISSMTTVSPTATSSAGFRFINDEQLLALVAPHPAILIRTGLNSEELVFAGPVESVVRGP
jgi:hypothetical protein